MTKTKKYVRILKAGEPSYWYVNKIGRMFEFEREAVFVYKIREKDGSLTVIRKEDAELIVTEKRPAKVGEKVLILDDLNEPKYLLHEVVPVIGYVCKHGVGVKKPDTPPLFLNHEQYEVIVNNEEAVEMENVEQRYDTAVETARDAIEELRLAAYAKGYEDARHELMAQAPVEKTAQERRDEIVERAKADVSDLNNRDIGYRHDFIVNSEKRTVVALRKSLGEGYVRDRGIAKAAPDDCFNVHIGKAIALHRALGLEVPDEYLNAPQPTEVHAGDIIQTFRGKNKRFQHVVRKEDVDSVQKDLDTPRIYFTVKIIDDSRTEVGEWL